MRILFFNILLLLTTCQVSAQNNDIFNGGNGDGWEKTGMLQAENNIYTGGSGDGWHFNPFQQPSNDIYTGGNGDGWHYTIYLQQGNAIFNGGAGDGWNVDTLSSADNNLFTGGAGDGWANTYKPMGSLPVRFTYFTATKSGTNASLLQWQTSQEINSSHFIIERSDDAVHFEPIGRVNAAGNSSSLVQYSFTDHLPLKGHNYYRIRQVDLDGSVTITPVRMLLFESNISAAIKFFPNPTYGKLNVEIPGDLANTQKLINVVNAAGIMVAQWSFGTSGTTISLDFSRFPKGVYFVQFKNSTVNSTQRIVLQ